jgi:type II restriction enzyme
MDFSSVGDFLRQAATAKQDKRQAIDDHLEPFMEDPATVGIPPGLATGWKRGKPFAMVVCPIYQLPTRSSQIYEQASSRNVCIFTYSHLAVLVEFSLLEGTGSAEELMHEVFKTIPALNPSKDASSYWTAVNRTMLRFSTKVETLWRQEKQAALESIQAAKDLALNHLALEREKIMRMSHAEALRELINVHKIEGKIRVINAVTDTGVLEIR